MTRLCLIAMVLDVYGFFAGLAQDCESDTCTDGRLLDGSPGDDVYFLHGQDAELAELASVRLLHISEEANALSRRQYCDVRADIVYVLDSSGSSEEDYDNVISVMDSVLEAFMYSRAQTMAALVFTNSSANTTIDLTGSLAALEAGVASWSGGGGGSMSAGLLQAKRILDGSTRPTAQKLVVLVSDRIQTSAHSGNAQMAMISEVYGGNVQAIADAATLKNAGIKVFMVGLGSELTMPTLEAISSEPSSSFVIQAESLASLDATKFAGQICDDLTLTVAASGDPHLENMKGTKFDLLRPGIHALLQIPQGASQQDTLLRVDADARHIGSACEDVYFQVLNITGKWAEENLWSEGKTGSGGYRYYAQSAVGRRGTNWRPFGMVDLKVVWGRTGEGVDYMNFFARHLERSGYPVGGLIGVDDHTWAETPNEECMYSVELSSLRSEVKLNTKVMLNENRGSMAKAILE